MLTPTTGYHQEGNLLPHPLHSGCLTLTVHLIRRSKSILNTCPWHCARVEEKYVMCLQHEHTSIQSCNILQVCLLLPPHVLSHLPLAALYWNSSVSPSALQGSISSPFSLHPPSGSADLRNSGSGGAGGVCCKAQGRLSVKRELLCNSQVRPLPGHKP